MDFDYPDFDEDFSLTPKPKLPPEQAKPADIADPSGVNDTPKPAPPVSGGQVRPGIPSIDRSTKPKPSPTGNGVNPPRNASLNSLSETKSVSESKNNLMIEAERKEEERKRTEEAGRRKLEEEQRRKLEEEQQRNREAEEQEARRERLQKEIQVDCIKQKRYNTL